MGQVLPGSWRWIWGYIGIWIAQCFLVMQCILILFPGFSHVLVIGADGVGIWQCNDFSLSTVYRSRFCPGPLHPLQVENCDSNSRLVVDEDGTGGRPIWVVHQFLVYSIILFLFPGFAHVLVIGAGGVGIWQCNDFSLYTVYLSRFCPCAGSRSRWRRYMGSAMGSTSLPRRNQDIRCRRICEYALFIYIQEKNCKCNISSC